MGTHNTRTLPIKALLHLYITYYYTKRGGEAKFLDGIDLSKILVYITRKSQTKKTGID